MPISATDLNKAYLAYFGRPVDFTGKTHFANLELADVIKAFDSSAESQALYGSDVAAKVNAIYNNLFNRDAEPAGLLHWSTLIGQGRITAAEAAFKIMEGALGSDVTAVQNKLSASEAFAAELNTTAELLGYSGMAAAAAARAFLKTVDATPASLTAAVAAVAATVATVAASGGPAGQTFTLTTGADTPVATAGNDTFNALSIKADGTPGDTLSGFDVIDGGAGTDTLNIYTDSTGVGFNMNFPATATVKNVEIVNILNTGAAAAFGDASKFEGATQLWQNNDAVAVTKLAATTTAGFKDLTATALSVTAADAATSANIALTAAKGVAGTNVASLAVDGLALNSVKVSGTIAQTTTAPGSAAASLALGVTVATAATTATINTAVNTNLTVSNLAGAALTTVDASASTGAVKYVTGANTVTTIKSGAGADDLKITTATSATKSALVESGAGNDNVEVATTGVGTTTVNTGAGNDTVTLTSGINTKTVIDGGEGTDTISFAGRALVAEDYVIANATLKNFEAVTFTGATAASVDASKLPKFATFNFNGNAADKVTEASGVALTTKANLEAASTGYKADGPDPDTLTDAYGGALSITQTGTGTIDAFGASVTLAVTAGRAANVASIVTGDAQTLAVTLTNNTDLATNPTADRLTSVNVTMSATENTALTSLTLSGNGSATVVGGNKLATIDASALGGTLAVAAMTGNITGGLTFTGHAGVVESVKLGSGTDTVTVASTFAKMDTITGFDAVKEVNSAKATTDVLVFDSVTLNGLVAAQATKVTLSAAADSVDKAFVEAAAADGIAGGVAFFQFDGNTYLFQNQGTVALEDGDFAVKVVGLVDFAAAWGVFSA